MVVQYTSSGEEGEPTRRGAEKHTKKRKYYASSSCQTQHNATTVNIISDQSAQIKRWQIQDLNNTSKATKRHPFACSLTNKGAA